MNEKEENREILSKYILKLIDDELDKDDCDMELIDRYNAILDEIDENNYVPDPKRKKQTLDELNRAYKEAASKQENLVRNPAKIKRRFNFSNWKIAVAVCLCLIIITPLAVSAFSGTNPVELIASLGRQIFQMEKNTPYDYGDMTFVRYGEVQTYESIEECFKQENINILYPSWLPEGTKIESVRVVNTQDGDIVLFQFNNDSIMFSVRLYSEDLSVYMQNPEYYIETYDEIECIIKKSEDSRSYNVIFVQDDCTYNMSIKNKEVLPLIIENLNQGE